jgi:hypothetical protein
MQRWCWWLLENWRNTAPPNCVCISGMCVLQPGYTAQVPLEKRHLAGPMFESPSLLSSCLGTYLVKG